MINDSQSQQSFTQNDKYFSNRFLREYKNSEESLLSSLFKKKHLKRIYHSHKTLADDIGFSPSTIKRRLKDLRDQGLIEWEYHHRHTNTYRLLPSFFEHPFIKQLLVTFAAFSLSLLLSGVWAKEEPVVIDLPFFSSKELFISSRGDYRVSMVSETYEPPPIFKKRGDKVEDYPERAAALKKINAILPLTKHGWIALTKYPAPALNRLASWSTYIVENKDASIHYAFQVCEDHCQKEKLTVARQWYDNARKTLNLELDTIYVDQEKLAELSIVKKESIKGEGRKSRGTEHTPPSRIAWKPDERTRDYSVEKALKTDMDIVRDFDENATGAYLLRGIRDAAIKRLQEQGIVVDLDKNKERDVSSQGVFHKLQPDILEAAGLEQKNLL